MPNEIKPLAAGSLARLDRNFDGKIDRADGALSDEALRALDQDGDNKVSKEELSTAIDRSTTRKGKRNVRRAERRLKKLEKAAEKQARGQVRDPLGVALGVENALGGGSASQAIGVEVARNALSRDLEAAQYRQDRVDECRTKLAKSWDKIAKDAKPATGPIAALAPETDDKKA